ncbi:MAG: hypothetical protein KGY74_05290 [Candidatus Cloacimonetes bacterium]|nr:hypothetical protein [Candidatus Cloacimonadota bacterium]
MYRSKRIVWIVDIDGWAFYNKAKHISNNIKGKHLILSVAEKSEKQIGHIIKKFNPDIVIYLSYYHFNRIKLSKSVKKIVLLDSKRLVEVLKNESA